MKRIRINTFLLRILFLQLTFFTGCQSQNEQLDIENPLPVKFGDPYILKASDGIYYMIGTGGVNDGFKMYSSSDLKNWKDEGRIYQGNTSDSWNMANFWAPELYEKDGKLIVHGPTTKQE